MSHQINNVGKTFPKQETLLEIKYNSNKNGTEKSVELQEFLSPSMLKEEYNK